MDINESNKKVLHDDDFLFTVELLMTKAKLVLANKKNNQKKSKKEQIITTKRNKT